jgi:hypothetical protein
MGDCNVTLSLAGRVTGTDVDRLIELLYTEGFIDAQDMGDQTAVLTEHDRHDAALASLLSQRNAQGVLDLYADDVDGEIDEDLLNALLDMGLALRWEWTSDGNNAPGFDVWDTTTGKGQRFFFSPNGEILVPFERMADPHYVAHVTHFLAINRAICRAPFVIGRSAHDLLADEAAVQAARLAEATTDAA